MERIEHHVCFGGSQEVWRHHSAVTGTPMTFSVFRRRRQNREMSCAVLAFRADLQRAEFYHQSRGTALRSGTRPGDCRAGYQSARQSGGG